jgi:hypothetical protein
LTEENLVEDIELGLFAELNRTGEFVMFYKMKITERSVDEWIEIFNTNVFFMVCGKYSVWVLDKEGNRKTRLIDNYEIKTILDTNNELRSAVAASVLNEKDIERITEKSKAIEKYYQEHKDWDKLEQDINKIDQKYKGEENDK